MATDVYLAYLFAVILLTATPGPMVILSMRHGIEHGVSGSILSAFTGMICICLMIILCFLGISQILQNNSLLRNMLLVSGVIYIFYLGLTSILQSNINHSYSLTNTNNPTHISKLKIIREMSIIAWTNPKDWIFFGLFLPQFINEQSPLAPQLITIIITFAVCELFFLLLFGSSSYYFSRVFNKYIALYKKILGVALMLLALYIGSYNWV